MVRIITNETSTQELQRRLIDERRKMAKAAALEFGCSVEEIKYRINNLGIYEFQQMTPDEMVQLTAQEAVQKKVIGIKKLRGGLDV